MESQETRHPMHPGSNVPQLAEYRESNYILGNVAQTVRVNEALLQGREPCLTQASVGLFLQPATRELAEVPACPTVDELPDAVINRLVMRDKAFWVDKPGYNAYVLHDAFYKYGIATEQVLPPHQDVFPRSYQYDLDCIEYRRLHACDPAKKKPAPHCRNCENVQVKGLTAFQLAWAQDEGQARWRNYPDLTSNLSKEQIRKVMAEVGKPFQSKACNWYNKNYPSVKYDCIVRKFSK